MRWISFAAVMLFGCFLTACNPVFNWREVHTEHSALMALLPCKPDRASRHVTIAGQSMVLKVMGCEAGGATFAVSRGALQDPSKINDVLVQWRAAVLLNMRANVPSDAAFAPRGSLLLPSSVHTVAMGSRADGLPVVVQAVWFAKGSEVFHAIIYGERLSPEATEAFLSGLTFQ